MTRNKTKQKKTTRTHIYGHSRKHNTKHKGAKIQLKNTDKNQNSPILPKKCDFDSNFSQSVQSPLLSSQSQSQSESLPLHDPTLAQTLTQKQETTHLKMICENNNEPQMMEEKDDNDEDNLSGYESDAFLYHENMDEIHQCAQNQFHLQNVDFNDNHNYNRCVCVCVCVCVCLWKKQKNKKEK